MSGSGNWSGFQSVMILISLVFSMSHGLAELPYKTVQVEVPNRDIFYQSIEFDQIASRHSDVINAIIESITSTDCNGDEVTEASVTAGKNPEYLRTFTNVTFVSERYLAIEFYGMAYCPGLEHSGEFSDLMVFSAQTGEVVDLGPQLNIQKLISYLNTKVTDPECLIQNQDRTNIYIGMYGDGLMFVTDSGQAKYYCKKPTRITYRDLVKVGILPKESQLLEGN